MGPMVFLDSPAALSRTRRAPHVGATLAGAGRASPTRPCGEAAAALQFGCKRVLISDDYWPRRLSARTSELVTEAITESAY